MSQTDAEVFERLRLVETTTAVHDQQIKSMKEGMSEMETRIKDAGKERETHILDKIEGQQKILEKILWGVATAILGIILTLATGWVKKVDQAHTQQIVDK